MALNNNRNRKMCNGRPLHLGRGYCITPLHPCAMGHHWTLSARCPMKRIAVSTLLAVDTDPYLQLATQLRFCTAAIHCRQLPLHAHLQRFSFPRLRTSRIVYGVPAARKGYADRSDVVDAQTRNKMHCKSSHCQRSPATSARAAFRT